MADPNAQGIVNLIELALRAKEEIEAVLSNPKLKPFHRERFKNILRNLDRIIDKAENPQDSMKPETLAEAFNIQADQTAALAAEAGFDLADFGAINEDALAIVTGQPADPPIAEATQVIIGRTEPGELRNLQVSIAAEILLKGGSQADFQARMEEEIAKRGIVPPEPFADRPVGYSEMVARTVFAEIQRARTEQRGRNAGIETGQVTIHGARDACRFSEGLVFTWDWAPRRKGFPTESEIKQFNPHFGHPNCKHGLVNYMADFVDEADAKDAARAAAEWKRYTSMSEAEREEAVKAANKEAADAMADAWDGEATEEGV